LAVRLIRHHALTMPMHPGGATSGVLSQSTSSTDVGVGAAATTAAAKENKCRKNAEWCI
jgi:hypothetical protein